MQNFQFLPKLLHYARTANNNISDYIDEINKACLDYAPTVSDKCNNPNILWLADTNPDVSRINHDKLQQLLQTSPSAFRIISRHSPVRQLIPTPNEIIKQKLYKIDDKHCPPFIDLAVGARVMVTKKLATQIGICNGATGTVHWEIDYRKIIGIYRNFDGKLLHSYFTTVSEVFLELIAHLRPF